jgi:hypothetical protein
MATKAKAGLSGTLRKEPIKKTTRQAMVVIAGAATGASPASGKAADSAGLSDGIKANQLGRCCALKGDLGAR